MESEGRGFLSGLRSARRRKGRSGKPLLKNRDNCATERREKHSGCIGKSK